jgi:hypothetical protein
LNFLIPLHEPGVRLYLDMVQEVHRLELELLQATEALLVKVGSEARNGVLLQDDVTEAAVRKMADQVAQVL